VLLAAGLVKLVSQLSSEEIRHVFGDVQPDNLVSWLLVFNFASLVFAASLVTIKIRRELARPTLRVKSSNAAPALDLSANHLWHLFISHNWGQQDTAALIKRQLQLLLPGSKVFLDVDDLEDVSHLETHIEKSVAMLCLLGTKDYFESTACKTEIAAANKHGVPLIPVYDDKCREKSRPLPMAELASFQTKDGRCPFAAFDCAGQVLRWHRQYDMQLVSLARIAEEVVRANEQANKRAGEVTTQLYVPGGMAWSHPTFRRGRSPPLYIVEGNEEAQKMAELVHKKFGGVKPEFVREPNMHDHASCRWLLLVSTAAFQGAKGEELVAGIKAALQQGWVPVLLWEPQKDHTFGDIIDSSPGLKGTQVYNRVAIEWHTLPIESMQMLDGQRQMPDDQRHISHCDVSERQLAIALGATSDQPSCQEQLWSLLTRVQRSNVSIKDAEDDAPCELDYRTPASRKLASGRVGSARMRAQGGVQMSAH